MLYLWLVYLYPIKLADSCIINYYEYYYTTYVSCIIRFENNHNIMIAYADILSTVLWHKNKIIFMRNLTVGT